MNEELNVANKAVSDFVITNARKAIEFQVNVFNEWVALNHKLVELTPAKDVINYFKNLQNFKK